MKNAWPLLSALAVMTCLSASSGCRPAAPAANAPVRVRTVKLEPLKPTTMERATTQPATVHANNEARIFSKASGYLAELKVDIGTVVKKGDPLAVISIPEMSIQRAAKKATTERMLADERRAESQLNVAKASAKSYIAKRDQAKADSDGAVAGLSAARVKLERVTDLVKKQAVAKRLQDEAQELFDVAVAAKKAADAAVTSADAELALATAQSAAAQADLDVAKAITIVAQRELDEIDELIKYATLTAPFAGVVTQRNVELGDLIRNAQNSSRKDAKPLFVVSQFDIVRVRVYIPERDVPHTTVGDKAAITLQALPGVALAGTITRTAGTIDQQTRTMQVEIDLDNANGQIRPGMFGQASITLAPPSSTLTLPANAVHFDAKGNGYVYLVDASSKVAIAEIQTGLDDGASIEITEGLTPSDQVIGPLLHRLKAGQTVQVN